jgi:hypothetical protein
MVLTRNGLKGAVTAKILNCFARVSGWIEVLHKLCTFIMDPARRAAIMAAMLCYTAAQLLTRMSELEFSWPP